MSGLKSEIIVLIDINSFYADGITSNDLVDHVKEAVSFQISRGAITNRKLIKLGLEPYLARVKWTYKFFDSSKCYNDAGQRGNQGHLQTLTYECWDMFEAELNKAVKSYKGSEQELTEPSRMLNIVGAMEQLNINTWPDDEVIPEHLDLAVTTTRPSFHEVGRLTKGITKYLYVFTHIPKIFSCLIHLANGVTKCRYSLSKAVNCPVDEIQICLVDLKVDLLSIALHNYNGLEALPCFWDEFYENGPMLRVLCLKKIMMIHKLFEMRYPWMYEYSLRLPLGYGLGMKRLRQWEWRIPESPRVKRETRCSPLRKCYSEDAYCLGII